MKIKGVLSGKFDECEIRGWIYRIRSSGGLLFAIIRDSTGMIQVTVKKSAKKAYESASSATIESSVRVKGEIRKDARAPGGYEIECDEFEVISLAEKFPIQKDWSEEYLLDIRHLSIRRKRLTNIFKIRSRVFRSLRDFFDNEGFCETQGAMFVTSACEGGSTLFKVPYFNKTAYLTQSSQFYLEALIYSLEKVYTMAPSFRAEKSRTRRHLTEYWHCEAEAAWYNNEDMMKLEEKMIDWVIHDVIDTEKEELEEVGRDVSVLERIKPPFERLRYRDALKELGITEEIEFGADEERALGMKREKPFFVVDFPRSKGFYHRLNPENPTTLLCHDMLAPEGYGEIIGGGERVWDLKEILSRIKEFDLNEKDYEWYIDLRRYGSVPHAGFGLGIDRFIMWITKSDHIRETIPFPRTINRIYP
jgi:asparaginyl-tRNA synthetase